MIGTASLFNRVSTYVRCRRVQFDRSRILHPIRNQQIAMARRTAEAYFRADPERAALLPILAQSNSTGAGWTDYHLLHRYIVVRRPRRILEFGSGRTTVVMAHALATVNREDPGCPPGHLYSMEDILRFHEDAKAIMPPQLSRYTTLIHSPKRESTWRDEIWGFGYSTLPPGPFDFVFVDGASLIDPLQRKIAGVFGRDLGKCTEALAIVITRIGQPVLRFLVRVKNALKRNRGCGRMSES